MNDQDYERANRITAIILLIMLIVAALLLSGCSTSSALTGLVGSKPEITAQAGAENVKQAVGVTAKQDASSKQETTFKESSVGKVDTSNKKQVSNSSIQAEMIKADKIEISNGRNDLYPILFCIACFFIAGFLSGILWSGRKKTKEPNGSFFSFHQSYIDQQNPVLIMQVMLFGWIGPHIAIQDH